MLRCARHVPECHVRGAQHVAYCTGSTKHYLVTQLYVYKLAYIAMISFAAFQEQGVTGNLFSHFSISSVL